MLQSLILGLRSTSLGSLEFLVLQLDLVEFLHVCFEVFVLCQSDKKLGLLGFTFSAIHSDGFSSNALELSVLVSADLIS